MDDQGILPPEFGAEEKERLKAFNAGYAFAYYGEVKPYDPNFQEDWEFGYKVGRFIRGE